MRRTGVHFALAKEQRDALWDAYEREDDAGVLKGVEAIEAQWDEAHLQETDKAWEAIHRSLTDGTLSSDAGTWPLSGAVLGGECIYFNDDCIVRFLDEQDVQEIAGALPAVTREWFAAQFAKLRDHSYQGDVDATALEYTWRWFEALRAFFARAAANGRSVVFTAR